MKIALVYDPNPIGATAPATCVHDTWTTTDTTTAIAAVQAALASEHEVVLIASEAHMEDRLLAFWPDIVINLAALPVRPEAEAAIPSLLERWHIPFTGSSAETLRTCLDRGASKRVLRKHGIPTPVFMVVQAPEEVRGVQRFPLSVKPLYDGEAPLLDSEALVHTGDELLARVRWVLDTYDQPALVETSLPGREFTVALLGNGATIEVLPLVERDTVSVPAETLALATADQPWPWASGERQEWRYRCPTEVAPELAQRLADLARRAFLALNCRDFCGVLVRLDTEEQPYILATNPLPGLLPHPETPSAFLTAAAARMTYPDLICHIWQIACQRYGLRT
jgi:D-alanine-D-alanine ligase